MSAAYDVFGNGRVAVKASYGRYAGATSGSSPHPGPSASSVNPATVITKTYNNWDGTIPYVPVATNLGSSTGGGGTQRLDTNLTALTTDDYTVGTEFGTRTYLMRLNVVRKIDKGGSKALDLAMPFEACSDMRTAVDPGRDNIVGTADDSVMYAWSVPRSYPGFGQVNKLITNLADGEGGATFTAYEATFSKQYGDGWSFLLSGTADMGRTRNADPLTPNEELYNWSFPKWNYAVKMNATYQLPFGVSYSSSLNSQSGEYYARSAQMRNALNSLVTVVVEGNAGRYDWVRIWDNRVSKSFAMGNGRTLQASLGRPQQSYRRASCGSACATRSSPVAFHQIAAGGRPRTRVPRHSFLGSDDYRPCLPAGRGPGIIFVRTSSSSPFSLRRVHSRSITRVST